MNYMAAFNSIDNIILYWDEPTITLDYKEHNLHDTISYNWKNNVIPNIVLSSATLPKEEDILPVISNFKERFSGEIVNIESYDCRKTITILTEENRIVAPHLLYNSYNDIQISVTHCKKNMTLLRYFDLNETAKFIKYINDNSLYTKERYKWSRTFKKVSDINMNSIKCYYLELLDNIQNEKWKEIYEHCRIESTPEYASSIQVTTSDAYTLTDGPTIMLTDNVEKVAKVYLKNSNIPKEVIDDSYTAITRNNIITQRIEKLEKDIEDIISKNPEKDKKHSEPRIPQDAKILIQRIDDIKKDILPVSLHDVFIPNKLSHVEKWASDKNVTNPFSSDISESIVEKIMLIHDVDNAFKVLLLMGIGVFTQHKSIPYLEIMKKLMNEQKLYLIISSSDFIYGTNYQFCHGYICKDLKNITQEKAIQALGRIGRKNVQKNYSARIRCNDVIDTLFMPQNSKPEVDNMNKLFA